MPAFSGGPEIQFDKHEIARLMRESDHMEAELGEWLLRRVAALRARRESACNGAAPLALTPSFWRALIHIWATSPNARRQYSDDARAGLVSATSSMDPRTLMSLIGGLLETGHLVGAGPAAA